MDQFLRETVVVEDDGTQYLVYAISYFIFQIRIVA